MHSRKLGNTFRSLLQTKSAKKKRTYTKLRPSRESRACTSTRAVAHAHAPEALIMRAQWSNIYYLEAATLLLPGLLLPFASPLCSVVVAEDFFRASHCCGWCLWCMQSACAGCMMRGSFNLVVSLFIYIQFQECEG